MELSPVAVAVEFTVSQFFSSSSFPSKVSFSARRLLNEKLTFTHGAEEPILCMRTLRAGALYRQKQCCGSVFDFNSDAYLDPGF